NGFRKTRGSTSVHPADCTFSPGPRTPTRSRCSTRSPSGRTSGRGTAASLHHIVAFNSLPRIALVPLVTMIFGFGLLAKVVLAWLIVFFIVFFNTFQGARGVFPDFIHWERLLVAWGG